MPKPTLSIGGTMTAAEVQQLATLLAKNWCPPVACEEGDNHPYELVELDDKPAAQTYAEAMEKAASDGAPFILGAWERNDSPFYDAKNNGVVAWLDARQSRLAWRSWRPAARDEDGEPYNGRIEVHGAGVPEDLEEETCVLDVSGDPIIPIHNIDNAPLTQEQLLNAARVSHAIFIHNAPPLVIEG